MWVAGVSYANEIAPPGMGATAQGLFGGVMMGLGAATGAVIGGMLYDRIGPRNMFVCAAVAVVMGSGWFLGSRSPPASSARHSLLEAKFRSAVNLGVVQFHSNTR